MNIKAFELERYFAKHEFTAKYLLSSSDCDGYALDFLLGLATADEQKIWNSLTLGYTESKGNPLLRESILNNYKINSIENVVVASPGELNFICMNLLLSANDHVITVSPGYQSLSEISVSLGAEVSYWKPNPQNWAFEVEDLEKLICPNTKLIVINFPHNPTGSYLSLDDLNKVIAIARKHDIYIFSDEMYHQLVVAEDVEVLPPIADLYEKGISLWGTSKTFGLAGLRIGWIVSQDTALIDKVVSFKDYLSICNGAPGEILSLIALNHPEQLVRPNIEKIKNNVVRFEAFAGKFNELIGFVPPRAGSTSFVKLNIRESAFDFSEKMVLGTGIMAVPAEMFGYEGKYIRVGFGRSNFSEILSVFDGYLERYLNH